jgi:hypothetical protein
MRSQTGFLWAIMRVAGQPKGGFMATVAADARRGTAVSSLRWGSWLMGLATLGFFGYAIIFFILNFTDQFLELGIGPQQVDVGRSEIEQFSPSLLQYISHLHIAIAGGLAAIGLAVLLLIVFGVRRGQMWAWSTAVATPVLFFAVALPAHYPYGLDTLGHLGPVYLALVLFVVGALLALRGLRGARA